MYMGTKILRLFAYAKQMLLMVFFMPAGWICRAVNPRLRGVWLVSERGNDACDNGYRLYEYLKKEHPEVNARYVITSDSVDRDKIDALGGAVNFRSFMHYLLYYSADYLIGTHLQPAAPDLMIFYHLASHGIKPRGKQVFLKHGVTKDEMKWLHRENLYLDMFVCGAKPEYEYVRDTFGHPPEVVQYVGFCRFDNLMRNDHRERMILLMPTWRGAHYPSGEAFADTAFCRAYQSLLLSDELAQLLEQYDYRLVFYPHVEMQRYMPLFQTRSERVILADKSTHDVQRLLTDCAMLVTDYSSVFFDVAFLDKPVIYYQFDQEEFRRYHYQQGYFDYERDGFGPVVKTEQALLADLQALLAGDMANPEEYRRRVEAFFPLHDENNCARTFAAIARLRK